MTVCYWCGAKDTLSDIGKELDDGKYKMVQCSKCKNAYYVINKEKMNKPKPLTNEEWFVSLPTEEKAEFLVMIQMSVMHPVKRGSVDMDKFIEEVEAWLKEPHKE